MVRRILLPSQCLSPPRVALYLGRLSIPGQQILETYFTIRSVLDPDRSVCTTPLPAMDQLADEALGESRSRSQTPLADLVILTIPLDRVELNHASDCHTTR